MKTIIFCVACSALTCHAQLVVTDPISDALSEIQHVEDIAKTVEMIDNQVRQITTLTQQLQQITAYVKAFGDPSTLLRITGADDLIRSLNTTGVGTTLSELKKVDDSFAVLRSDLNGLYQGIDATVQTPGGIELPRAGELYRKFVAVEQTARNFSDVFEDVSERRRVLKDRVAETTEQLQAAATDAETQKLTGVLAGYNAELGSIDKEVDHALAETLVLDIQNRADREKQEQARAEERQAEVAEALRNYSRTFRIDSTPARFPQGK
ncbi:MAG: hypothetical protein JWL59_4853 [Chthoniobacteraceae bacterium]|nr:hypothetical protein [Chthoniobacteraceae bacterium]